MIKFKHNCKRRLERLSVSKYKNNFILKRNIKYYKRVYKKIENKFDMQGEKPEEVTKKLLEYIKF